MESLFYYFIVLCWFIESSHICRLRVSLDMYGCTTNSIPNVVNEQEFKLALEHTMSAKMSSPVPVPTIAAWDIEFPEDSMIESIKPLYSIVALMSMAI